MVEEHELESFRESSVFPIFPFLRTGLLHRTGIEGYKGIGQSGYIIPNQGQFPYSFPQSKFYYSHHKKYVCLFDFELATEEECIIVHDTWVQFFSDHKPVTIVLRLNRQKLGKDLIPNSAAPKLSEDGYKAYIPYVEAWYPKPIPVEAIDSYIIIMRSAQTHELIGHEFSKEEVKELEETLNMIEEVWEEKRQERKAT